MPTSEQIRSAADAYAAAVSSADKSRILAQFAADATVVDPYPSPPHVGHEAIGGFWDIVLSMGTPKSFKIEKIAVAGDAACFLFTLTVAVGEAGQLFGVSGFDVITVGDDGLISSLTAYWDPGQMAEVTG